MKQEGVLLRVIRKLAEQPEVFQLKLQYFDPPSLMWFDKSPCLHRRGPTGIPVPGCCSRAGSNPEWKSFRPLGRSLASIPMAFVDKTSNIPAQKYLVASSTYRCFSTVIKTRSSCHSSWPRSIDSLLFTIAPLLTMSPEVDGEPMCFSFR